MREKRRGNNMKTKNLTNRTPYLRWKEINSVWREALYLAKQHKIPKGHIWDSSNEKNFYFLDKGSIRINAISPSGQSTIILHLDSGCLFREWFEVPTDEAFLIQDIAVTDCVVYSFPMSYLENSEFICKHSKLISNVLYSLTIKASSFARFLLEKGEYNPKTIVCNYLVDLASQHNHDTFTPNISQTDLALSLGLHRVTVCNVLKNLRAEGVIGTFTRKNFEILNKDKLKEYCTL